MDEKKRQELTRAYREWICSQVKAAGYRSREAKEPLTGDSGTEGGDALPPVSFGTEKCEASVEFYPQDIIQLSVVSRKTGRSLFYLHFQINEPEQARQLFLDMLTVMKEAEGRETVKILLSCSNGCTTSFFADKMNRAEELLDFGFHFDAVSYRKLAELGKDYRLVFLAPQVGYLFKEAQGMLGEERVRMLPAAVFAAYNVGAFYTILDRELETCQQHGICPDQPEKKVSGIL